MNILTKLRHLKIELSLVENKLKINAPEGVVTKDILEEIKANKDFLITHIKKSIRNNRFSSIPRAAEQDYYALSSVQKRLHFLYQFNKQSTSQNLPQFIILEGEIDIDKMTEAFRKLIARHDSLRTSFHLVNDEPVQKVDARVEFNIEYHEADRDGAHEIIRNFIRPFVLEQAPLFRIGLVKIAPQEHIMMVDVHHIVSDGSSERILVKDFMALYQDEQLSELPLQYKDYATWQQTEEQQKYYREFREFWLKEFSDEPTKLDLPYDFDRPAIIGHEGSMSYFELGVDETRKLNELATREEVTMFMMLMSIYAVMLAKLCHEDDVVIGTPTAGRQHADFENIIGMFVNTIPMRNHAAKNLTFREFLANTKIKTLACFDNQAYQLDALIEDLRLERDPGRNLLFDFMFSYQNWETAELTIPGLKLLPYGYINQRSHFDMCLSAFNSGDRINLNFEYATALFKKETVERFIGYFKKIVDSVLANPGMRIADIDLTSDEEKRELFSLAKGRQCVAGNQTAVALLEARAASAPHERAVTCGDTTLSYRQLNERANQLAWQLTGEWSVKPGDKVGLMVQRSEQMIVALLGILKSGAAYVPIDPAYPTDRIRYMITDSGIKLLVSDESTAEKVSDMEIPVQRLDDEMLSVCSKVNPNVVLTNDDLAYVIYTSGSTGTPKGVMINHAALADYAGTFIRYFEVTSSDVVAQQASLSFDTAVEEIYPVLCAGGRLVIMPEGARNIEHLVGQIVAENITILSTTPLVLNEINDTARPLPSLRLIISGGDELKAEYITKLQHIPVYNTYGPTESTVCATYGRVDHRRKASIIGKPIDNRSIYLLDDNQRLVPKGTRGEICIGGRGLAVGYHNNDALTASKFVYVPELNERIYLTGDLGRWTPDGELEFLGRKDDQVKIRGFRIELGEIEAQLMSHADVSAAAVIVKEHNGDKYLAAYYVAAQEIATLRSYLSDRLPEHMVPSRFARLDALPLNANGKLDKKALPDVSIEASVEDTTPLNALEEKLAAIWSDVLKLDLNAIGANSNFFDLGGHSLKAMRVVSRVNAELQANIELKDIFIHPTIRSLARTAATVMAGAQSPIPNVKASDYYELSHGQKRLWLSAQVGESQQIYHLFSAYELSGELNIEALRRSFDALVKRHEILRTVFPVIDGAPRQKIKSATEVAFDFHLEDYSTLSNRDAAVKAKLHEHGTTSFNLAEGPLMRVALLAFDKNKFVLALTIHHIISDAWSSEVMVHEALSLYDHFTKDTPHRLPELRIQYKDFAAWQHEQLSGGLLQQSQAYWHSQFSGELPVLNLPTDYTRPAVRTANGGMVYLTLDRTLVEKLQAITRAHDATLFVTMLSAIKALLYRYTGQEDIVIGSPVAERLHRDLEGQIGFYINLLAFRTRFHATESFDAMLDKVKETVFSAYPHQHYPFDKLIEDLSPERDPSRSPLFDVGFTWQSQQEEKSAQSNPGDLTIKSLPAETNNSRADLWFFGQHTGDKMYLSIEFNTDLFSVQTMERMGRHFVSLLQDIADHRDKPLYQVDYISTEEKQQLIQGFNATGIGYPSHLSVQALFEQQVNRTPGAVAIQHISETLTYHDLNARSNRLARYLNTMHAIAAEDRIAIMVDRTPAMIVGLLGILKAGAAYVPVDPGYPDERKRTILSDAGVKLLITDSEYVMSVADYFEGALVALDIQSAEIGEYSGENIVASHNDGRSLAYIMYTSGSTGKPKGVMIEHRSIVRLVYNPNYIAFDPTDKLVPTGSLSFDASTLEIWGMLLNGGSLCLCDQNQILDPEQLERILVHEEITTMWLTSALFNELSESSATMFSGLRWLLVGGDKLSPKHINKVRDACPKLKIVNGYGPTENTTFSICHIIDENYTSNIPVGKPITNSTAYILDAFMQVTPVGVAGEICVGGDGLARGYLNQEALTSEKFVSHPYQEGARIYRTGDLGRWRTDGTIEFLGRKDSQVKIRGYRIEPGEIEHVLAKMENIEQAVVIPVENADKEKQLVAYFTAPVLVDPLELSQKLIQCLPTYLVPAYLVQVPSIPLNANGKVDKKALPAPWGSETAQHYVAPQCEEEEKMASIWQDVLHKTKVGTTDNFFNIGGDSIKAIRVVSLVNKALNTQLEVKDIFQYPDIGSLWNAWKNQEQSGRSEALSKVSAEIDDLRNSVINNPELSTQLPKDWEDIYPMSGIVSGMLYYDLVAKGTGIYHDQLFTIIDEADFNFPLFKQSFMLLVAKHEMLRSSFHFSTFPQPVQVVHHASHDTLLYEDISRLTAGEQEIHIREAMRSDLRQPFEPTTAGLWRITVYRLGERTLGALWMFHHAILDGWSVASLQTELAQVYQALKRDAQFKPSLLKSTYKDYVADQLLIKQDAATKSFWKQYLEGCVRTPLPLSPENDPLAPVNVKAYSCTLDRDVTEGLSQLADAMQVHMKEICLAAFMQMLKLTTPGNDITVGLVTHGRPEVEDGDKLIGCFLNTVPVRQVFGGQYTPESLIGLVSANARKVKAFDKLPLADIAESMNHDAGANPFFDIIFNYLDFHVYGQDAAPDSAIQDKPVSIDETTTTNTLFDFTVTKWHADYLLNVNYRTNLYSERDIARVMNYFVSILRAFALQPGVVLQNEHVLAHEEVEMLKSFNHDRAGDVPALPIAAQFTQQAQRAPHAAAVSDESGVMTYAELDSLSDQFAHYLVSRFAIRNEERVAVMLSPSINFVATLLGIVKAGAAYVVIDRACPAERAEYIINHSGARLVVTDHATLDTDVPIVPFDVNAIARTQAAGRRATIQSEHLVSITYTSGSQGAPIGIAFDHRALQAFTHSFREHYALSSGDVLATYGASEIIAHEIFPILTAGGKLAMFSHENSAGDISQKLKQQKVSVFSASPDTLKQINNSTPTSLRTVISSGDVAGDYAFQESGRILVYNSYGPLESLGLTAFGLLHGANRSIGKPASQNKVYVIDQDHQLVPVGACGQIAIASRHLAHGYWKADNITAVKFITNPFDRTERLYLTGDMGRWTSSGMLELTGRLDAQVKIHGVRVAPEEVAQQLKSHLAIDDAVVMVNTTNDERHLAAYYTGEQGLSAAELKQYLAFKLPHNLVPRKFTWLEKIPMMPNGKPNLKALSNITGVSREIVKPGHKTEEQLAELWAASMGVEPDTVSVLDNFFEMGLQSLKATSLIFKIRHAFGRDVSLMDIFQAPTIRSLAKKLQDEQTTTHRDDGLVKLSYSDDTAPTIFFIHDGTGEVTAYLELSRLLKGYNCWGLRSKTLQYNGPIGLSIQDLAAHNIDVMRSVQPAGPYSVAGWSLGGMIAHEIVCQLESQGEPVQVLLMMDTYVPSLEKSGSPVHFTAEQERGLLDLIVPVAHNIIDQSGDIEHLWKQALSVLQHDASAVQRLRNMIPADMRSILPDVNKMEPATIVMYGNTIRSLVAAAARYRTHQQPEAPAYFIQARETGLTMNIHESGVATTNLIVTEVSGDHYTMLMQPHVSTLAAVIEEKVLRQEKEFLQETLR